MYLTIYVCMVLGIGACKPLPLPEGISSFRFDQETDCVDAGKHLMKNWLVAHRDWQEGGVRCSVQKP